MRSVIERSGPSKFKTFDFPDTLGLLAISGSSPPSSTFYNGPDSIGDSAIIVSILEPGSHDELNDSDLPSRP